MRNYAFIGLTIISFVFFQVGERIRVILDCDDNTLSFEKNYEFLGVAFRGKLKLDNQKRSHKFCPVYYMVLLWAFPKQECVPLEKHKNPMVEPFFPMLLEDKTMISPHVVCKCLF